MTESPGEKVVTLAPTRFTEGVLDMDVEARRGEKAWERGASRDHFVEPAELTCTLHTNARTFMTREERRLHHERTA